MNLDVEQLVRACKRRNPLAQQQLYEAFAPMMLGVCRRYVRSREEAQDLLHDGFVKVFESIDSIKNPQALEDWIYHIMVNTSVNYLKRHMVRFEPLADDADTLPAIDTSQLSADDLAQLIQMLPDTYRLIFNLREVEGRDFASIAATLGIAEVSVRSSLSRAKKMLRNQILKQ